MVHKNIQLIEDFVQTGIVCRPYYSLLYVGRECKELSKYMGQTDIFAHDHYTSDTFHSSKGDGAAGEENI